MQRNSKDKSCELLYTIKGAKFHALKLIQRITFKETLIHTLWCVTIPTCIALTKGPITQNRPLSFWGQVWGEKKRFCHAVRIRVGKSLRKLHIHITHTHADLWYIHPSWQNVEIFLLFPLEPLSERGKWRSAVKDLWKEKKTTNLVTRREGNIKRNEILFLSRENPIFIKN